MYESKLMLDLLHKRFFEDEKEFSDVTSSHWRKVGWHQANFEKNGWKLKGAGFGDWMENNLINRLRTLSERREVSQLSYLHNCQAEIWQLGIEVAKSQNRLFNYDCAKQVLSLARVVQNISSNDPQFPLLSANIKNVCVIGDGYGYLGALIKSFDPGVKVTSVNLGRGLLFDAYYTVLRFPNANIALYGEQSIDDKDFVFLAAEDYSALEYMPQDLVINIASMQEMNIAVVQNYVGYIRRRDGIRPFFYCCNRIEKILPDGESIRFDDYGWIPEDEIIFDEPCPWYQTFPKGIIARWLPFDGVHKHRLILLS
jgi:hypothetical protein